MSDDVFTTSKLSEDIMNRLMFVLMQKGVDDLQDIRNRFQIIFSDYKVEPKETALVVYTEGKNEYFLKRFILAKAVAGCTVNTLRHYEREDRKALQEIGKDADQITSEDIQVFLARTIARSSKTNANNLRRNLSSFFTWLVREELIPRNPMLKIDNIKTKKKEKPAFTEMDVEKIRNACRTNRERAAVEVLLSTGCRVSEVCSMKLMDIDEDKLVVLGKGEKYRTVYLNAKAMLALSLYTKERQDANPYLFPGSIMVGKNATMTSMPKMRAALENWYKDKSLVSSSAPVDKSSFGAMIRKLGKHAGVENCHPHRFRRTCATFALRRGMPIEQVSKMLGHANIETTQIYLDLTEDELAQAHRKFVI